MSWPSLQEIVVGIGLVGAGAAVEVFLQPEGIHRQGGAIAIGGAAQHAVATGIVDIPFLVGGAGVPLHHLVEVVVREGRGGATGGAAGDVAPMVVDAGVALAGLVGAGRRTGSDGVDRGQLVGVSAVAVEILVLPTAAV